MPTLETLPKGPSQKDIQLARESAKAASSRRKTLNLQINGSDIPSNSYLNKVVQTCLQLVAEGHPIAVLPADEEIGSQEAADLLRVSRPYMVKLLDTNAIPSRKVGVQRRVRIEDVLAYKTAEKESRMKALTDLAAEDQRLNLGE